MRFLVDESVPLQVTRQLRTDGFDVWDPREQGPRGLPDEELARIATAEKRVIVTYDLDFGRLARQGVTPAGVILFRFPATVRPSMVAQRFRAFVLTGGIQSVEGHLVVITPGGIRKRRLPSR